MTGTIRWDGRSLDGKRTGLAYGVDGYAVIQGVLPNLLDYVEKAFTEAFHDCRTRFTFDQVNSALSNMGFQVVSTDKNVTTFTLENAAVSVVVRPAPIQINAGAEAEPEEEVVKAIAEAGDAVPTNPPVEPAQSPEPVPANAAATEMAQEDPQEAAVDAEAPATSENTPEAPKAAEKGTDKPKKGK